MLYDLYHHTMKFWAAMACIEQPGWMSENTVVADAKSFTLRCFTKERSGVPILVLGPQAGHHTCLVDFAPPDQSLVHFCVQHTNRPVYTIEWKNADATRRYETIDHLIAQTNFCTDLIGGKVELIGLCQGGWQAMVYATLFPHKVQSLVVGGAPIDATAGGGHVQEMAQTLPMSFYEWLVILRGGIMRGHYIMMGFKSREAYQRYIGDYLSLFDNINDPTFVNRFKTFRRWYDNPQDLAGAWYLQAVKGIFKKNLLWKGDLKVFGQKIDLKTLKCPLVLVVGEDDDISLPPQTLNAAQLVSTPRENILEVLIPDCGHIGLFTKKVALEGYWSKVLDFIIN